MELKYGVTGEKRKRLAQAVSDITGEELRYLGVPTFNYEAGYFTIDRSGTLIFDDRSDSEVIENLIEQLYKMGFEAQPCDDAASGTLSIEMPADKVNIDNLRKIIDSKADLIKKALGINELPIEITDEKISFPWFSHTDNEQLQAYTSFITALCEMSRELKRVTAKKKETPNEKYAFRCFLLRLGFIGSRFKNERRILLANLEGSSAFKNGVKRTA